MQTFKVLTALPIVVAAMVALPMQAQLSPGRRVILKKTTPEEKILITERTKAELPLLFERQMPDRSTPYTFVRTGYPTNTPRRVSITLTDGTTLVGNLAQRNDWTTDNNEYGMYSFVSATPNTLTKLVANSDIYANGGGAFVGDYFYYVNADTRYSWLGVVDAYLTKYNTETWEQEGETTKTTTDMIAMEVATDNATGTVYGEFYDASYKTLEWGIADYEKGTRSLIATATNRYVALGITKAGQLYGIATDGNLYKVDKTTGAEEKVGATGVTLTTDDNKYYAQSGEIDQTTDTFYWNGVDSNGNSAFYTVDLTTGTATKIADFANNEIFLALSIPPAKAADGAPAKATDITVSFPNGSTSGQVSFTAPTNTYGGQSLTETELTYTIKANDTIVGTGTVGAGATATCDVTAPEGQVRFTVTTSNAAGESPKATADAWVGYDQPQAVGNPVLAIDNATGNVSLSWTEPAATGMHGGYVGILNYDVYRLTRTDTTLVGNTASTTFSETLPKGELQNYTYGVVARNEKLSSSMALSNGVVAGSAYEVPYFEDFKTESVFDLFTVINVNNDSVNAYNSQRGNYQTPSTWECVIDYYSQEPVIRYHYNKTNAADDWLITPPIKLKAGHSYTFSIAAASASKYYPERFEVKMGQGTTVGAMTTGIIGSTDVTDPTFTDYKGSTGVIAEDGEYNFGIHAISDAYEEYLTIDSITVRAEALQSSPDSVTNLTIKPSAPGSLIADISFTAPAKTISQETLSSLSKIEISRNGKLVKTLTDITPGQTVSVKDTTDFTGYNEYIVLPYIGEEFGRADTLRAYLGYDAPMRPVNAVAIDQQNSVLLKWDPVTEVGARNGYVDPSKVEYNILDFGGTLPDTLVTLTGTTQYQLDMNTDEGNPRIIQYAVNASNEAGSSAYASMTLTVGTPYELPFTESFANGGRERYWSVSTNGGSNHFTPTEDKAADGDKGATSFTPANAGDESTLHSGKISLGGATNPELFFSHMSTPGANTKLIIEVEKPDGSVDSVKTIDYSTMTGTAQWKREKVSLADYKDYRYIIIAFHAIGGETGVETDVDNIVIENIYSHDLTANLSAATYYVTKGQKAKVSLVVTNKGDETANGYTATIYKGNEVIADTTSLKQLAQGEKDTIDIEVPTTTFDEGNSIVVKAVVDYDADENITDNTAQTTVALKTSSVPTVQNLEGTSTGNKVTLTWEAPTATSYSETETFDYYQPWSIEIPDWTMVDGNKGKTGGISGLPSYEHEGDPYAFIVFNPEELYPGISATEPHIAAHSGNQYMASPYETNPIFGGYVNANNWIISPQLSGEKQTVSFFARNMVETDGSGNVTNDDAETFRIRYSTEDTDTASFATLRTEDVSGGEWKQFDAELPEGAKYFAIQQVTPGRKTFLFAIDDITYRRGIGMPVSYNIYNDGKLIGSTSNLTAEVDIASGNFAVTAVYADGTESEPVTVGVATEIGKLVVDESNPVDIFTIDGKLARRAATTTRGLKPGVYVAGGQKIIVE